jgi:AraC-like DNA-binding protein
MSLARTRSDVAKYIEHRKEMREVLLAEAPRLVEQVTASIGLREAARRLGLSCTYLSRIKTGHTLCSPETFLRIADLLRSKSGNVATSPPK